MTDKQELVERLEERFPGQSAIIAEFINFAAAEVARNAARWVRAAANGGRPVPPSELHRIADDLLRVADELVAK